MKIQPLQRVPFGIHIVACHLFFEPPHRAKNRVPFSKGYALSKNCMKIPKLLEHTQQSNAVSRKHAKSV